MRASVSVSRAVSSVRCSTAACQNGLPSACESCFDAETPQALHQQLRAIVGRLGHFEDHGAGADRRVVVRFRLDVGCFIRLDEHHAHDPVSRHGLVDELH